MPIVISASTSIPGVFTPAKIGDRTLVDGGIVANVAVDTARAHGADIVIASNITENVIGHDVSNVITIILQAINVMMEEMSVAQLANAGAAEERSARRRSCDSPEAPGRDRRG